LTEATSYFLQHVDGYSTENTNQPNVTISGLASGSHVFQLQISGNTTGSDIYTTVDSFTITGSPLAAIDDINQHPVVHTWSYKVDEAA
jgi:hypothetical protein